MSRTVWEQTSRGHHLEITWSGALTSLPTGALDESAEKRTRYFFDVLVDGLFYFGNRFLTSSNAEGVIDDNGVPILTRTDALLALCADRVIEAIEAGSLSTIPNDLGYIDIAVLARTAS